MEHISWASITLMPSFKIKCNWLIHSFSEIATFSIFLNELMCLMKRYSFIFFFFFQRKKNMQSLLILSQIKSKLIHHSQPFPFYIKNPIHKTNKTGIHITSTWFTHVVSSLYLTVSFAPSHIINIKPH